MAEVKVLIEGYAKQLADGWVASSTTCLVTAGGKKIITDPGCNREKLLAALAAEGLATSDIDSVFLSHQHPDHVLLAGLFERAKFVTFDTNLLYDGDRLTEFDPHVLGPDIEVLDTPGHVLEHLSLLVTTPNGRVAIAGDAIWWRDGEPQIFALDQFDYSQAKGADKEQLIASRKKIIAAADSVIPGHGRQFTVTPAMKAEAASFGAS